MHYAISSILILAATSFPATMGAPRPQFIQCGTDVDYQITSQEDVAGTAMTGDYSVSGVSGGEHHLRPCLPCPKNKAHPGSKRNKLAL